MKLTTIVGLFCLLLVGCSSQVDSHKYYKFTLENDGPSPNTLEAKQRLYIDTISILGAANQQALVQYTDTSRVNIANFHYWAEHPENMLAQATQSYLSNEGIYTIPLSYAGDDLNRYMTLKIVVREFAGHFTEGAILKGNWYLYQHQKRNKILLSSSSFSLSNTLDNDGFDALVIAHRKNWQSLMEDVSSHLEQFDK
ncbi:PqiC family protein [Pseudoalteromonas sp. SMS1]|uniref:PqiC family protein n=1 Tax=Pseudoalteromonas sp. SMS1 TaxID=2908894 RepID=UPI001F225B00|nr:ABC-type transport auxiliary lipoprotein family protein [Pseudoalteromonas sp. SMS1]MCF2856065.1 PqiC family protein [Pseudoalteromonas sp. SMS1]